MAALALLAVPVLCAEKPDTAAGKPTAKKRHISKEDRDKAQQVFLEGARDLQQGHSRAAMDAFARAATLNPEERQYSLSAEIARQHLVSDLVQQADKARILGHLKDSQADIAEAFRIDPSNPMVAEHVDELTSDTVAGEPALHPDIKLQEPVRLKANPVRRSFHLRASQRTVIAQVLTSYGIQSTFDNSVGAETVRYDIDDADFAEAERSLGLATNSFFVTLDPSRVLVARDTTQNRKTFERQVMETVYLPGMAQDEITEMVNIARNVFGANNAIAEVGQNAMSVRGPEGNLQALNDTLTALMEGRGEIRLDVHMYEVDRTKAVDLGLILPNQTTLFNVYSEASSLLQSNSSLVQQIISSGLAAPNDWEAILAILVASGQVSSSVFSGPFAVFGGGLSMTGLTYGGGSMNMQLNSSDVHAVDQMQLRVMDHEEATIRAGERYPIETSNYSSLSATPLSIPGISSAGLSSTLSNLGVSLSSLESAASETIPQVQYQDIGLTLQVTPRIQGPHDVSLKFDLKLSSLAGSAINGLPILDNREFAAITSLRFGESAILVSALSRQESDSITGIPGLSELPGFQDTTNKSSNLDYSELAVVITPHLIRKAPMETADKMILLPHHP